MNFLEALNSDKPFKRSVHENWMVISKENGHVILEPLDYINEFIRNGAKKHWPIVMEAEEMLSNDWEIRE